MGWTVDLTGDTAETVERGRNVDPDWYVATLSDTYEDLKSGAQVFEFDVVKGAATKAKYANDKIFDRLYNPDLAEEGKEEMTKRRMKLFASRLGLLKPDSFGRQADIEWLDAVGQTFVLHVKHREYKDKDNIKQEITSVDFSGIFPPTHEKIPADIRKTLDLPPATTKDGAKGQQTTAAGATAAGVTTQAAATHAATAANGTPPPARPAIDTSDL